MKLNLKFQESDFDSFKSFEKSAKKQIGQDSYVGTDSLCFFFPYPKTLVERIRPYSPNKQLEFELNSCCPDKK